MESVIKLPPNELRALGRLNWKIVWSALLCSVQLVSVSTLIVPMPSLTSTSTSVYFWVVITDYLKLVWKAAFRVKTLME